MTIKFLKPSIFNVGQSYTHIVYSKYLFSIAVFGFGFQIY